MPQPPNEHEANIKQYLEAIVALREGAQKPDGWLYSGVEDFLLKRGKFFTGEVRQPTKKERGPKKGCYENAGRLAMDGSYTYCEGMGSDMIPTGHAWLIDPDGKLVDPTWGDAEKCGYFGVEFPPKLLNLMLVHLRWWGMLWPGAMANEIIMRGGYDAWMAGDFAGFKRIARAVGARKGKGRG